MDNQEKLAPLGTKNTGQNKRSRKKHEGQPRMEIQKN